MIQRMIEGLGIARAILLFGVGFGFAAGLTVGVALGRFVRPRDDS